MFYPQFCEVKFVSRNYFGCEWNELNLIAVIKTFSNVGRVCHGFRLTKRDDYFRISFDYF
jgi:hypothetical protein